MLHINMFVSVFLLLPDVCLKDTMSVADSLYNLQLIKEFCESSLQSCCPLAVEDMLYAPPVLHVSMFKRQLHTEVSTPHKVYWMQQGWTERAGTARWQAGFSPRV